jgi:hypothetical protein
MIIKNTSAEKVYLPIYQPETAPNALNAYVPAGATVNLVSQGNAEPDELWLSEDLKNLIHDGTFLIIQDGTQLNTAESIASFDISSGAPNGDRLTTNFLDNATEAIPLTYSGHSITEKFVKALGINFSLEVDSVTTIGNLSAIKTDSGWYTESPFLSSQTTPNETLSYSITVGSGGALSLTITGSGTGQSVAFNSLTKIVYGI